MAKVVDEECTCGHRKSNHGKAIGIVAGHGSCHIHGCKCLKFTWILDDGTRRLIPPDKGWKTKTETPISVIINFWVKIK